MIGEELRRSFCHDELPFLYLVFSFLLFCNYGAFWHHLGVLFVHLLCFFFNHLLTGLRGLPLLRQFVHGGGNIFSDGECVASSTSGRW